MASADSCTATACGVPGAASAINNDDLPSAESIRQLSSDEICVFDQENNKLSFKDLYSGADATSRVLIIFVRHFYCPACQEYLQSLFQVVTSETLPPDTSIKIVGCGEAQYIDIYKKLINSPFPIYADPTRKVHDILNLAKGGPIAYNGYFELIRQSLKAMSQAARFTPYISTLFVSDQAQMPSGDPRQQGGEFLFESKSDGHKTVTWCHRAAHGGDHTLVTKLTEILGVNAED